MNFDPPTITALGQAVAAIVVAVGTAAAAIIASRKK